MLKRILIGLIILVGIVCSGCIGGDEETDTPVVELVYMSGCGTMPSALANDQLDAYIAWQPMVSVAEVAEVGKVITYSENLPPDGQWTNHPCCCLVSTDSFIEEDYDIVKYLTMLMISADSYIETHTEETVAYCADWLFGGEDLAFGDIIVNSYDVEEMSIETIRFVTEPSEDWLNGIELFVESLKEIDMINDKLVDLSGDELLDALLELGLYNDAYESLTSMDYLDDEFSGNVPTVSFGYLPSDHDAALFVAAYDWEYFRDNVGIYLYSDNPGTGTDYQLYVNETLVANVNVIEFSAGSAVMTAISQGNLDYAIIGAPPAIMFIDQGSPAKIISPVQTEGSGVVVANDVPADNWDEFIDWIKEMYAEGDTVKIGVPMIGAIQDVMIKYALQESGIDYKV
ncbi:MAG TPA: ABC transporter substrate-binding protein [Candidatus Methanofastidiosa archaeon]|nr:ABC transporter substrate-binding protein [Candidatus Methanofastidiosa archaeon]HPR41216.1 ABC transporter substrate-binding protein [Candidatus Methanofastidiosa archaeon]